MKITQKDYDGWSNRMKKNKIKTLEDYKCECGFEFSKPGYFRNCDAFITEDTGESGVICPKCNRAYICK